VRELAEKKFKGQKEMAFLIGLLEKSIVEHALIHFEKFYKTILIKTV